MENKLLKIPIREWRDNIINKIIDVINDLKENSSSINIDNNTLEQTEEGVLQINHNILRRNDENIRVFGFNKKPIIKSNKTGLYINTMMRLIELN